MHFPLEPGPADQSEPDLSSLPINVDKRGAAELITRFYFPVSYRSLERWPIAWRSVNGRNIAATKDLLAEARRRLLAAPAVHGGRRVAEDRSAA
jgi:hypothetical protein